MKRPRKNKHTDKNNNNSSNNKNNNSQKVKQYTRATNKK